MTDFNSLQITSVNDLPGYHAKVAFSMKTAEVFKESGEISPRHLSEALCYMPWGADDQMPFDIINLIESDETLSTCQMFNAEVCYGSGLVYDTSGCKKSVVNEVEEFALDNDLASYSASRLSAALGKVQTRLTLLSLARQFLGYRYHRGGEHDVFHHACALEPGRFGAR